MTELATQLVPVLATALLHFLWQGAAIGLLAWLALAALRGARPQARYMVACTALLACVALPLWHVLDALGGASAMRGSDVAALHESGIAARSMMRIPVADWPTAHAASPWVVALWATGCALLSLRMALGLRWVRQLLDGALPADAGWQARLDRLAARLGIDGTVALRIVADGDSPVTAGWWRPVVLLPAAVAARMPVDLVEALLAHELAHVRRHDYLVNLLQGAVEALLFYHPVVWWLSHRIRVERELVADDLAAVALGERRQLAVALAELDRLAVPRSPFPHAHFAQAAHGDRLMPRIRQLIHPDRRGVGAAIVLPLLGLAVAGAAFYAHARRADAPPAVPPAIAAQAAADESRPAAGAAMATVEPDVRTAARTVVRARGHEGYALVRKGQDGFSMSGDVDDVEAIRATRRSVDADFLWFRRDGKAWIVRDADALASARAAWQPTEALDRQMRALDGKMRPHSERMQALGKRMESLHADAGTETPEMQASAEQMQALGERMQEIARQQVSLANRMQDASPQEHQRLQGEVEELDARQQALQQEMARHSAIMEAAGRRIEASRAPMEALGREMEAAGRPMQAIGEEMEAVGARIEQMARVADGKVRAIIDDAYARGLATPAPAMQ